LLELKAFSSPIRQFIGITKGLFGGRVKLWRRF
ncbi:MAG: hypothetical protein ACI8PG_000994, partial [Planctomycetota bacterium]